MASDFFLFSDGFKIVLLHLNFLLGQNVLTQSDKIPGKKRGCGDESHALVKIILLPNQARLHKTFAINPKINLQKVNARVQFTQHCPCLSIFVTKNARPVLYEEGEGDQEKIKD